MIHAEIRPGDRAHCVQGTKDAWGEVLAVYNATERHPAALLVEFPGFPVVRYPETLVRITGLYVIPMVDVLGWQPKEDT